MIVGPCRVLTGGLDPHVIEDGAVRVVGAHIAQVGRAGTLAAAYPDDTRWPARGRILVPGLVNTHAHLARHLARGIDPRTPAEWDAYDRALSPEDVRVAAMAALLEGVRHGVTTICDFHRSHSCVDLSLSEILSAAEQVGSRVATCYGVADQDSADERRAALEENLGFADHLARRRQGRVHAMLGVEARTLPGIERLMRETLEFAGDRFAVHVDLAIDSTPAEAWTGGRWPEAAWPALWAHAERAPRRLLGVVTERGDTLSAIGRGCLGALLGDAELGWGSDAGVNAPPVIDTGPAWASGAGADLPYRRLFVNGADWAAPHFGVGLGRIAAGAPADLVMLEYRPATELSPRTLRAHLGAALTRAPVSGVMVAGEIVMDNGMVITVDEEEVAARAREAAARIWGRLDAA